MSRETAWPQQERTGRPTLLEVRHVKRDFAKASGEALAVLDGVNFEVRQGEIIGLLGRSGSGKSTLLRIAAGLLQPTSGEVLFHGQPVDGPPRGVSMVFQSFALFPWLTVQENVELGLEALGVDTPERRRRALQAIDLIGLDGFENAYPRELSGGMRQRVGFARALVMHPDLLLMDEPFSALDVLTAETLRTDLIDLWMEDRLPVGAVLIVTHNIEEAVLLCDRILIFSSNPGRVAAQVRITLPHPRNRQDPRFRKVVDDVYARMTRRAQAQPEGEGEGGASPLALQPVSTNIMAGMMEAVAGEPWNGRADLPDLARDHQLEADEMVQLGEALQLLGFADMKDGDLHLTDAGLAFAGMETDARKDLFAHQLIERVPLVRMIRQELEQRTDHRVPAARFRAELEDAMSESYADQTLNTAVSWGRYAELFSYDEQTEQFSLDDPE
ncbi:nitrate/sulfonate/bicarbonate ABC transporter ATP-binding protein [Camelimonas lactis]|uniref:NitT/TauT family transport system ATP-binding protein n=1 Tax=Camelimonas lactis TaxID=659006 RepID=A0A4R2GXX9_9HYPH|nr:nitrate/sulfonate/bicarbonate ABC transporter ATP-binding protein [Camelimonas lactis]TCO16109.1 NitT/TauT family transport system ATP-binding protein [Camelimonas lactis]